VLVLTASSANELYTAVCRAVRRQGRTAAPRGMRTREVIGAHLMLTDPRRRLVNLPPARVLNPAFAVAEAMWILSGSDDPWIFAYNRSLTPYADGGRLRGAYGPRIRQWRGALDQLDHVRRLLATDANTRQAVIQIYDPQLDTCGHRDVPCTLNYRFFLRSGRLDMHTTMRSNDVWLGLPYDLFTATTLHELMAGWLGAKLGIYHHHVDSLHLYAQHKPLAAAVAAFPVQPSPPMPALRAPAAERFDDLLAAVIAGNSPANAGGAWSSFAVTLASYRDWTGGDRPTARAIAAGVRGPLGAALNDWYNHLAKTSVAAGAGR
jgi:thymidylate synthase